MFVEILSWIFILLGSAFLVISAIGVIRLPDVYTRMHAAGITDTMGMGLLILGMALQVGFSLILVKLFLILAFVSFASPTATHALAQAALSGGVEPFLNEDRRPKETADLKPVNSNEKGAER